MRSSHTHVTEPVVLAARPEFCLAADRGAVVGIHRAPLHGPLLKAIREALQIAVDAHPAGLVCLSVFRLSRHFPLDPGFDKNVRELADTLRAIDRMVIANATLIEFGGVRAVAMRLASRAVIKLARPRAEMADFDRLTDAIAWVLPFAKRAGAPSDHMSWVKLYRHAERHLPDLDAVSHPAHPAKARTGS
ncbi:MAG: hypothetical protein HYV09_01155 [Deltaproteobacteria bacterium]|nr:hypothetical protein [Deltaproteobacteria bacterium]